MSRRADYRSIGRNAGHLLAARLLARGLRIVYLLALARLLGPELFALLSYAQFWQLLFFTLVIFGTGRLLSRDIGRDPAGVSALLATTLTLRLLLGLVIAPVVALAGWWLAPDPAARPRCCWCSRWPCWRAGWRPGPSRSSPPTRRAT
jgi:O-antigen/teichoic acid export membrane protein